MGALLGREVVSARSRTGRRWLVTDYMLSADEYKLAPLGHDVSSARSERTGRWQGGVRRITVAGDRLHDERYWRTVT
jgi:hypothetical protein